MKKLLLLVLCLVLAMSFALTSCDLFNKGNDDQNNENNNENNQNNENKDEGNTHTHAWGEWTVVTPATCLAKGSEERACSGCTEKETRDVVATGHSGVLVCDTCYESLVQFDAVTLPSVEDLTSFGLKITDFSGKFTKQYSATQNGVMGMQDAELYITIDDNGNIDGYGKGKLAVAYSYNNRTSLLDAVFYIEDNVIWFDAYGVAPMTNSTLPTDVVGYVNVTDIPQFAEVMAQVEQYAAMAELYVPTVAEWYEETLLPLFASVKLDGAEDAANKYTAALLNSFFVKTETGAALNLDTLKTWYASLLTDDISVLVDKIVGEGAFASIEALVADDKTYDFSVADVLSYLETEQGIVVADLLDALDALVAALMPAGEGEPAPTLEQVLPMLGIPSEMIPEDIAALLEDEEFLALSIKDAIIMISGAVDDETTDDVDEAEEAFAAAKKYIVDTLAEVKEMTVYEIMNSSSENEGENAQDTTPQPSDDNAPYALTETAEAEEEEEVDPIAEAIEAFNAMIEEAKEMFALTVTINNGIASSVNFVFTAPGENQGGITAALTKDSVSIVLTSPEVEFSIGITSASDKITLEMTENIVAEGVEFAYEIELIPNYTIAYDAEAFASLKTAVNAAETEAKANFSLVLADAYKYDGLALNVLVDEQNERYIVVVLDEVVSAAKKKVTVDISVYYVDFDAIFGVAAIKGCNGAATITPIFNVSEGSATLVDLACAYNTFRPDYTTITSAIALDIMYANEPDAEYLYETSTSGEFILNADGTAVETNYDGGHNFVKDEANSTAGDSCTDVYYTTYVCSNDGCNASYVNYYTNGHQTKYVTTENNGTYVITDVCTRNNDYSKVVANMKIDNYATNATITPGSEIHACALATITKPINTAGETINVTLMVPSSPDRGVYVVVAYDVPGQFNTSKETEAYAYHGKTLSIDIPANQGTCTVYIIMEEIWESSPLAGSIMFSTTTTQTDNDDNNDGGVNTDDLNKDDNQIIGGGLNTEINPDDKVQGNIGNLQPKP